MNPIPLPYRILAAVVLAASIFAAGDYRGNSVATTSYELKIAKTREATQRIIDAQAAVANTAATKLEIDNAQARIIYRTITESVDRVVDRPVYLNTCLDADGLQLANAALAGVAAGALAEPDSAMPDAAPAQ